MSNMFNVRVKKIYKDAKIPTKAHSTDAGFDIYYYNPKGNFATMIQPNETVMLSTGFAIEIPNGYFGGIYARSGLATKEGLAPANAVGIVDSGYRNEVKVALHNFSFLPKTVEHGERIAQLIIQPYPEINFVESEELDDSDRGMGGFGDSGKF